MRDVHLFPHFESYNALPYWIREFHPSEAIDRLKAWIAKLEAERATFEGHERLCCAHRDIEDDDWGVDGTYNPIDDEIDEYEAILDCLTRHLSQVEA